LYLSAWGLGGSILTAAGFAMMHTSQESYSPGIMDTSSLHYGPEPEPESTGEPSPEAKPEESPEATESAPQSSNE
jgi:hypothetical protein